MGVVVGNKDKGLKQKEKEKILSKGKQIFLYYVIYCKFGLNLDYKGYFIPNKSY